MTPQHSGQAGESMPGVQGGRPGTPPTQGETRGSHLQDWSTGYAVTGDTILVQASLTGSLREARHPSELAGIGGSFAAVLRLPDRVRIVSDRLGSRPVFYARTDDGHWATDEDYWALAKRLNGLRPCPDAAMQMLAFKYVLGNATISERIMEAEPGSCTDLFPDGRIKRQRYWRFQSEPRERPGRQLVDELADVFTAMSRRSTRAGAAIGLTQWGVNLTAGRDSRVIFGELVRAGVPVTACTSGEGTDAAVAARVAASVGATHTRIPFWDTAEAPLVPDVSDPLVATTMAAVAGQPISLALNRPENANGWVSGHLGDVLSGSSVTSILRSSAAVDRRLVQQKILRSIEVWSPGELQRLLRREWQDRAQGPQSRLLEILAASDSSNPITLAQQVRLEQRQRRFILRDYMALRSLGPSVLWFADPGWIDFWATVPPRWLIGTPLYSRALKDRVWTGALAPLGQIPVNGQPLRSIKRPRLDFSRREWLRKVRKRISPTRASTQNTHTSRLSARELELVSWLLQPDALKEALPRHIVESARSIARATELLSRA